MQMWAVADMELKESKTEEREASNALADGQAIELVAADAEKVAEARARKELTGQDLDAALAVAHDDQARRVKDAKQIEDVAAKEEKDAGDTKKEGVQVRADATAIETAAMPAKKVETEAGTQKDAVQMRIVADIEEKEAKKEQLKAADEMGDSKAIQKAAAITAKAAEARAAKELSTNKNDLDAADAVAEDEEKRQDTDAAQIQDIATKEAADAEDTMTDATRLRKDAAAIDAVVAKK